MKKILALLLCAAMLFMVSCGSVIVPADNTQIQDAADTENPPIQDVVTTESQALTVRENPSTNRVEENIAVFGNEPGTVINKDNMESFPNANTAHNRIGFEGDRISFVTKPGVYLVDGYIEKAEKLLQVMEATVGLTFADAKLQLFVMDAGNRHSDFDYIGGEDLENRMVQVGQGDAFLGNSYELITYLAFILQMDHAPQRFNAVLANGFATYATFDILSQLETSDPEFASSFAGKHRIYSNYYIFDPDVLYGQPITYWMENEYPYDQSNGSASVGFWLMRYLDDAYGDYTKWITSYDDSNGTLDVPEQIQLLKDAYGEDVLDGFYPWLRKNLEKIPIWEMVPDHTALREYVCYPFLVEYDAPQELLYGEYSDVCVSLTQYRHYLTQVKEFTIDELTLIKYTDVEVALYDADGTFLQVTRGTQTSDGTYLISLDDAYYFRILEQGFQEVFLDLVYTAP